MILMIAQFALAALAIVIAGAFLTRFADRISDATGWGRMFVGGLFLAAATSLPELTVDFEAIKLDQPNLVVGDLLGSSLFNLLVLAILDFAFPSAFRRTSFSPVFLHHALAAVLTIVLTAIVGIGIASNLDLSYFGVSLFGWAVLLVYLYGLRLIFLERSGTPQYSESGATQKSSVRALIVAILGYVISASVVFGAAPYLAEASDVIAKQSGLGHTFIGTTLLAFATSLPELVATVTAFRIGAPDLALGNIFGSNAFNMVLFVPLDFLYPGILFHTANRLHAVTALAVTVATGVAVMGQLYRRRERSRFAEPSSETVVLIIFLSLLLIYHLKSSI